MNFGSLNKCVFFFQCMTEHIFYSIFISSLWIVIRVLITARLIVLTRLHYAKLIDFITSEKKNRDQYN